MKGLAFGFACVAAAASGCGGGTPGRSGSGGSGVLPDGAGGNFAAGVGGAAGAAASSGSGGDGVPSAGGRGGGSGGVGGGSGGLGGSGSVICPPPGPPVCGTQCGNGVIDACNRGITPECTTYALVEECDAGQFGKDSCTARGYGSGALTCSSNCTVDKTTCSDCMPNGGALLDCRPAPITFPYVGGFGIAATDSEIGLAQIDYNLESYTSRLSFARLDTNLALRPANVVELEDTAQAGPLQGTNIDATAVAATASGWLVAGCGLAEVFVHAIDLTGTAVGRTVVASNSAVYDCLPGTLSLVLQPGGVTLLLWGTNYGAAAALIAADGRSVDQLTLLPSVSPFLRGNPTAAWIGDTFFIAAPIFNDAFADAIRVLSMTANGTTTVVGDILESEMAFAPGFARGAADMRLIYSGLPVGGRSDLDVAVLWRRLGPAGELLGPPVTVGVYPNFLGRTAALAFGDDTVILLNGFDRHQMAVIRIDKDGKIVKPAYDVAISPDEGLRQFDMVRRGTDIVVGWLQTRGAGVTLARITP